MSNRVVTHEKKKKGITMLKRYFSREYCFDSEHFQ